MKGFSFTSYVILSERALYQTTAKIDSEIRSDKLTKLLEGKKATFACITKSKQAHIVAFGLRAKGNLLDRKFTNWKDQHPIDKNCSMTDYFQENYVGFYVNAFLA